MPSGLHEIDADILSCLLRVTQRSIGKQGLQSDIWAVLNNAALAVTGSQ